MTTKTFQRAAAAWLAASVLSLSACSQKGEPPVIQSGKDAQGNPVVHVDGKQVDRNLDQANQNLKEAGREMKEGAENAGQALERGAKELDKELGPVLDDASLTAKIKAKLVADPEVKAFHIDVDTVDGHVALNGKVSSAE
jgi:osmotically-inducible protein OsmY